MNELRQPLTPSSSISWPKLLAEFVWVVASMLLWLLILFAEDAVLLSYIVTPIRVILGLLMVLYFPGYCLQVVLFPRQTDLDNIERLGLSLGLSIAWVSVLALILNWLPTTLSFEAIVVGMLLSILFFMITAVLRRAFITPQKLYLPAPVQPRQWWQKMTVPERRIIWGVLVAIILMGGGLFWSLTAVSSQTQLTEFYMLGDAGLAENFPREARVGEPIGVQIGINQVDAQPQSYRIEIVQNDVWTGEQWVVESVLVGELIQGETWQQEVSWTMPESGKDQQVLIYLIIEGQDKPYRELRLWLNIWSIAKDE